MTVKKYLGLYKSMEAERLNLIDELNKIIEEVALENGAVQYDKDRVQTTPSNDAMFRIHERIEDRSKYISRQLEFLDSAMNTIKDQINMLEDFRYKRLLYLVYINGLSLEDACREVRYSVENKGRIHGEALESFRLKHNENMTSNDIE